MIHHGDCLDVLPTLGVESVDAIVTDPPYDLLSASRNGSRRINNPDNPAGRTGRGFMGKTWDGTGVAFRPETWEATLRVAKPGAYLLAFGGTRTYHRMTVAIEDAGWLIRDCLVWAYASGFPKSRALLKPAWEPIVMARKPGPLRMLNIEASRIRLDAGEGDDWRDGEPANGRRYSKGGNDGFAATPSRRIIRRTAQPADVGMLSQGERPVGEIASADPSGRWPANVVLTDPIFDGGAEGVVGGGSAPGGISVRRNGVVGRGDSSTYGAGVGYFPEGTPDAGYGDSGTYSRFFLIPKEPRAKREPVTQGKHKGPRVNTHPTVKPVRLLRHLVRLVTPDGGTVLDPFLGSGSTALACEAEGFAWVGIEMDAESVEIAAARLPGTQRGLGLPA